MSTISFKALLHRAGLAWDGREEIEIGSVTLDSRAVTPGAIFVAIRGFSTDGHHFIQRAIDAGAAAIIAEEDVPHPAALPFCIVDDTRKWFGLLNAALYDFPSSHMTVVGVTGTDGKTSTTTMLWEVWHRTRARAGALTTVDHRIGDDIRPNRNHTTTPEADAVQRTLAEMRNAGCTHVALETSSHALALDRIAGVRYAGAIYTQVTSEHLDVHQTREAYLAAKLRLLELTAEHGGFGVLNRDDAFAYPALSAMPGDRKITYSTEGDPAADLVATDIISTPKILAATLRTPWGTERLTWEHLRGRFNVSNSLAALAGACETGVAFPDAIAALQQLSPIEGRMERIDAGQRFSVIMDFAHTEQSLEVVLRELKNSTAGRLWVVFGSAGERDHAKRHPMGMVAGRYADVVILTDEDPRHEDGREILEEIALGAEEAGAQREQTLFLIPDRTAAIQFAVTHAAANDCIVCAGKGHEHSIDYGDHELPWNERAVIESALAAVTSRA